MADRYWVGGTATWDATAGTKWAATSGGTGGASVPTSADDVFFDANSGTGTVTVSGSRDCNNITFTGFAGTLTGTSIPSIFFRGNVVISTGMTITANTVNFRKLGTGASTFLSAGKTIPSLTIDSGSLTLSDALTFSTSLDLNVLGGTFNTNNYNVTGGTILSSNTTARTINLGSSTLTLSGASAVSLTTDKNLTLNAGTSSIVVPSGGTLAGGAVVGGTTFNNVSFTSTTVGGAITGVNVFNNLSFAGRTSAGVNFVSIGGDQTINGTLTLSPGTDATMRTFVSSSTIGTTRTLTCANISALTDIDFRDIAIAGAAAPVSGTRLGDCKGNTGITFDAPKTVYYRSAGPANWGDSIARWSITNGGTADFAAFPLAQDTAVFPSSPTPYPSSGSSVTVNTAFNIGTIDMSARTSNTMTLATGTQTPAIYGNWINGTGTTLTGTGTLTFAGRGSQTITSAGKTFTQPFNISTPGGSVTLQDAFTCSASSSSAINLVSGTFNAATYNVTLTVGGLSTTGSATRTVALGTGTWTLGGGAAWTVTGSNVTVTGTGTISLTNASGNATFAGGGIQTYPAINQGVSGALTITGSNKFTNITNLTTFGARAAGAVRFTGGTTNEFTDGFGLQGVAPGTGEAWAITATPTASSITAMASSGSLIVATTQAGGIFTSPNGTTWTSRTSGTTNGFTGIVWASTLNLFVAVCTPSAIRTSTDGVTWLNSSVTGSPSFSAIAWSGSVFVATSGADVYTSSNASSGSWTLRTTGLPSTSINAIAWSPTLGLFVVVGTNGVIGTSPDGITWTSQTSGTTNQLVEIIWAGSRFVAFDNGGFVRVSTDGVNWSFSASASASKAAWNGSVISAGGFSGAVATSPDAVNWTSRLAVTASNIRAATVHNGRFFFGAQDGSVLGDGLWVVLNSTNTTQATVIKPTAWNVGANSIDSGNNTNVSFIAGANDYLNVSYINGVTLAAPGGFFMLF